MLRFVNQLFNIHTDEWSRIIYLYVVYFIFGVATVWANTITDASVVADIGLEFLPIASVLQALITIPILAAFTLFVDHVSIYRMMIFIVLMSAVTVAVGVGLVLLGYNNAGFGWLYLLYPVGLSLFSLQWWNYFDEFYDTLTAKRVVPVVASAFLFATILAGLSLRYLNTLVPPVGIIIIWMLLLLVVAALIWYMPRFFKDDIATDRGRTSAPQSYVQSMREGYGYIIESPFLRWTAISAFLLIILIQLIGYESSRILIENLETTEALSNFTSTLLGVINIAMLPVQLFLFSRIVNWLGVESTNLIFPFMSLIIVGAMVVSPPLVIVGALGFFDRTGLRNTFQGPVEILMFNTVSLRIKGRAGAVIAGIIQPFGSLVAGALLIGLTSGLFINNVAVAIGVFVVALLYLVASLVLRREYAASLLRTLREEDFSFILESSKEVNLADPTMLDWLTRRLDEAQVSGNAKEIIFVAHLITQMAGQETANLLSGVARSSADPDVRLGILELLIASGWNNRACHDFYVSLLKDEDDTIRCVALGGLNALAGSKADAPLIDAATPFLDDPDLAVRGQAIAICLHASDPQTQIKATRMMNDLVVAERVEDRVMGAQLLGGISAFARLFTLLEDPADQVRVAVMNELINLTETPLTGDTQQQVLHAAAEMLEDSVEAVRLDAVTVLGQLGTVEAYRAMLLALTDPTADVRNAAVDLLAANGELTEPLLIQSTAAENKEQRKMAVIALCRIRQRTYDHLINPFLEDNLNRIYHQIGWLASLEDCETTDALTLLRQSINEHISELRDEIYFLLTAENDPNAIKIIARSMRLSAARANATEALESLTTHRIAELMSALYDERLEAVDLLELAHTTHITNLEVVVEEILDTPDLGITRSIAVYWLGTSESLPPGVRETMLMDTIDETEGTIREAAQTALDRLVMDETDDSIIVDKHLEEDIMLSKIEKVIFLKQVDLFEDLTVQQLTILAGICQEITFEADQHIFKQGDEGDSMYIIINGNVSVKYQAEDGFIHEIARRGSSESFGEMSLFDDEPRSASVIALRDTLALRLDKFHLNVLAHQHPQLLMSFIRILSERLREASERIGELEGTPKHIRARGLGKILGKLQF